MFKKIHVLKRTLFYFSIYFLGATVPKTAHAVADFGNAAVLPVGRHQTTFRFGNASDVQEKFNNTGTLESLSRMNQRFDNATLMKNPEFRELAKILDEQLVPNQKPSSKIDLGATEFIGKAQVSYFVPQVARGITSNWSLGIALPFIKYESNIRMQNIGVNTGVGVMKGPTTESGEVHKRLGAAVEMFNGGGSAVIAQQLKTNGYKAITTREESLVGDLTLGSSFKITSTRDFGFYLINQLTLPTGPKDDPDDLLDINIFGKTEFQTTLYTNYTLNSWAELGLGVSYILGIPGSIEKRVPRNQDDKLPPLETKENLEKDPGDAISIQLASIFKISDYWQAGAGGEMKFKNQDKYSGSRGLRYDLLEKNTDSESYIAKFKFSYTTLDGFLQGNEKIPYSVTYAFANSIAGQNIERELTHEVLMKFYF